MGVTRPADPSVATPFWDSDIDTRLADFAVLRQRSDGLEFIEQGNGSGFWSVTSYAGVRAVSRDPLRFTSTRGFSLDDMPPELLSTELDGTHRDFMPLVTDAGYELVDSRWTHESDELRDLIGVYDKFYLFRRTER